MYSSVQVLMCITGIAKLTIIINFNLLHCKLKLFLSFYNFMHLLIVRIIIRSTWKCFASTVHYYLLSLYFIFLMKTVSYTVLSIY